MKTSHLKANIKPPKGPHIKFFFYFFYFLLKTIHNTTKLHTALLFQKRITKITYNTPFYKL